MIVYFSATGNSKYVSQRLAAAFDDTAVSVEGHSGNIMLGENEMLGIVTPVYCWELPTVTREFLERMTLSGSIGGYTFVVATFGSTPGCVFSDAGRILSGNGYTLNAGFSVRMPDTWTPLFDLSDPGEVRRQNEDAEGQIETLIGRIRERAVGNQMQYKKSYAVRFFSDVFYNSARKTKNLYVEDTCIGCGLCARKCPVGAIEIRDKKPVWVKDRCALCFRCLHHCPKFSIQYGNGNTKKHGQYRNPNAEV